MLPERAANFNLRNAITIRVGSFAVISGKQIETVGNLSAASMKKAFGIKPKAFLFMRSN